jgi:hypothetical protein
MHGSLYGIEEDFSCYIQRRKNCHYSIVAMNQSQLNIPNQAYSAAPMFIVQMLPTSFLPQTTVCNHSASAFCDINLMAYGSASQAAVSKDRIYAMLGLAKDRELAHPIVFKSEVRETYSKLVEAFVEIY